MLGNALGALLRWFAATLVGICVVVLASLVDGANSLALTHLGALAGLGLLVLARRFPRIGAWLGAALLASAPVTALMVLASTDTPLLSSFERCGTGDAALWIIFMPMAQALMALGGLLLFRLRRRLGRAWAPATLVALAAALTMLLPGTYRYWSQGSADRARAVIAKASPIELPELRPHTEFTTTTPDLIVDRECETKRCELALRRPDAPHSNRAIVSRGFRTWSALTIHRFERWHIVEGISVHGRIPGYHAVFDTEADRMVDLRRRDIAPWFGPSGNAVLVLLMAVALVLGSLLLPTFGPLVWRRLGALQATRDPTLDDVVALRIMHLAIVVLASLPMLAYAVLGAVF